MGLATTIVGAALVVGAAVKGAKAESAERKGAKHQRRLQQLQALRDRKQLIRDVQFARAAALTSSLGSGIGFQSSTIRGQQASQISTLKDDLGFQDLGGDISQRVFKLQQRADRLRSQGNLMGSVGQTLLSASSVIPSNAPAPTQDIPQVGLPVPGARIPGSP